MGKRVNQTELATIMGVSEVTIWEWQKAGMPVVGYAERGKANEYDTSAVIAWKIEVELAKIRKESPRDALYLAQRRLVDIQIGEKEKTLVPIADVEPEFARMVLLTRQQLLQISAALPVDESIRKQVDLAIKAALKELSHYEPSESNDSPAGDAVGASSGAIDGRVGGGEALPE